MNYFHYFKAVMCVNCGTPKRRNSFATATVLLLTTQLQNMINIKSADGL